VRAVLTDQTDFTMYAATMEIDAAVKEVVLFSNIEETRAEKPSGYPEDKTTETNRSVAMLNGKSAHRKAIFREGNAYGNPKPGNSFFKPAQ